MSRHQPWLTIITTRWVGFSSICLKVKKLFAENLLCPIDIKVPISASQIKIKQIFENQKLNQDIISAGFFWFLNPSPNQFFGPAQPNFEANSPLFFWPDSKILWQFSVKFLSRIFTKGIKEVFRWYQKHSIMFFRGLACWTKYPNLC